MHKTMDSFRKTPSSSMMDSRNHLLGKLSWQCRLCSWLPRSNGQAEKPPGVPHFTMSEVHCEANESVLHPVPAQGSEKLRRLA